MVEAAVGFLISTFPILGTIGANALAIMISMNLLIEAVELIAAMTASKADDELAAKIKGIAKKIISVLEVVPHINVPLAPAVISVTKIVGTVVSVVIGALKGLAGK